MRLAVDFSENGGAIDDATIECWKANGVEQAIVQYSQQMPAHLAALDGKGLEVAAYVYLYWGLSPWDQTPQDRTRAALAMVGNKVTRLWLDAEDDSHPYREDQLLECAQLCRDAGMPVGIYTGRWWWEPRTGNSQAFSNLPLWHAEYGNRPESFDAFQPYGGWTRPTVWQYQGTALLCGHSVDLNVTADAAAPAPIVTSPEPPLLVGDVGNPDVQELMERRAKAELDIALLTKYRCQPRPGGKVELVDNAGTPFSPRLIIDVRR